MMVLSNFVEFHLGIEKKLFSKRKFTEILVAFYRQEFWKWLSHDSQNVYGFFNVTSITMNFYLNSAEIRTYIYKNSRKYRHC